MSKEEEENKEYPVGSLLSFRNLTEDQETIFIKLLSDNYSALFQILYNIFGDQTLELVDIFAGQKIQFPNRKRIYKTLEKVQIYTFIKSKDYSDEAYRLLAKQYKIRTPQIKSTVERIDHLLNNGKFATDIQGKKVEG